MDFNKMTIETLTGRKIRLEERRTKLESLIGKAQANLEALTVYIALPLSAQLLIEDGDLPALDFVCLMALYLAKEGGEDELTDAIQADVDAGYILRVGEGADLHFRIAPDYAYLREALA